MRKGNKTEIVHICDECAHGVYDRKFENLDYKGDPILIACAFFTYKHLRKERACQHFELKP